METGQAPKQTSDARSLHALVDELKLVQSPSVLDSGAVLFNGAVLLLPKNRCCCAGSCHGVGPQNVKEIRDNKHSLEGLWEISASSSGALFSVHTDQAKSGYLFITRLDGSFAKQVVSWFRSGSGGLVLGGKNMINCESFFFFFFFFVFGCFADIIIIFFFFLPQAQWADATLKWHSNNAFAVNASGGSNYSYVRATVTLPVVD